MEAGPARRNTPRDSWERSLADNEQSRSDAIIELHSQIGTNEEEATAVASTESETASQVFCHMSES